MPVTVKKVGKKWRVVEAASGNIARNKGGTALDGGGHESREKAVSQSRAVNMHLREKKER